MKAFFAFISEGRSSALRYVTEHNAIWGGGGGGLGQNTLETPAN